MATRGIAVRCLGVMFFVEFLGAVGTLELMAFTGNTEHRNSQNQQGEKFHRATA